MSHKVDSRGGGSKRGPLPREAQYRPIHALTTEPHASTRQTKVYLCALVLVRFDLTSAVCHVESQDHSQSLSIACESVQFIRSSEQSLSARQPAIATPDPGDISRHGSRWIKRSLKWKIQKTQKTVADCLFAKRVKCHCFRLHIITTMSIL